MLEIVEAVDGPMASQLDLMELAPKEKFSSRTEQVYAKAIAQARAVFAKTKLSTLVK
jgi:hypothetical protein